MQLFAHITFNGNCREAMTFYQQCLGGELTLQTVGESPMAGKMPPRMKEFILHATLASGNVLLMGSDMTPEKELTAGNTLSFMLSCSSEKELKRCFEKLSSGGNAEHPVAETFWGGLCGNLTDRYGNQWILNCTKQK